MVDLMKQTESAGHRVVAKYQSIVSVSEDRLYIIYGNMILVVKI